MEEAPQKEEKLIGKVTHFFNKIGVAVLELQKDSLKVGETLHFKGGERDFEQKVDSMQIEHQEVSEAKKGESIGLKVEQAVREGDQVFKVLE
jgi:translation elongation factor EF-1alpha